MALSVSIISGGVTYHLTNSSGSPTRGGAPTAAATTPFSLAVSEWTQTAAERQLLVSGGPPFRVGSAPVAAGYGNVVETLEVGVAASSADNLAELIRTLRQALITATATVPAILVWQPHGSSQAAHFEIYSANVQEVGDWQNPSAGFLDALLRVTWERSPFGGRLSSGVTVLNAVAFGNQSSGGTPNLSALGAGAGDLLGDRPPMNLSMTFSAGAVSRRSVRSLLATVASRAYTSVGVGVSGTQTAFPWVSFDLAPYIGTRLRPRILLWLSNPSSNLTVRLVVGLRTDAGDVYSTANNAEFMYASPTLGDSTFGTGTFVVDMGGWAPRIDPTRVTAQSGYIWVIARSSNGASISGSLAGVEVLACHSFARIASGVSVNDLSTVSPSSVQVVSFMERSGRVALPQTPVAYWSNIAGAINRFLLVRGTPPVYAPGASLWMVHGTNTGKRDSPAFLVTTGDSYTVTATMPALYATLRGAG